MQYSPEQISGRLYKDTGKTISIETIYQFVYRDKAEVVCSIPIFDGRIEKEDDGYMEERDIESMAALREKLYTTEILS